MDDELAALVRGRYRDLVRRAYLLTGNEPDAQDLVQEALARCCRAWRHRPIEHPDAYLQRTMVNLLVSRARAQRLREIFTNVVPDHAVPDGASERADRDLLWAALQRVPPRQRAILVLRFYEGLGEREIAELLEVTVGTIRSQSAKGLQRLRRLDIAAVDGKAGHHG